MQNAQSAPGSRLALWLVIAPAVLALAAMAIGRLVWTGALWWDVAWTSAAVSATAGTLLGRRAATSYNRGHWTLWAAASGCWLVGQLGWDLFSLTSAAHVPSSPNIADFSWWAFAVLVMLSLVRMRTRSRALLIVGAAEILPVIAAAAALTFALLWHDAGASMLPVAQRLSALVYPALYVAAAVLALQALIGGALTSVRLTGARVLLVGVMVESLAFILWSKQLLDRSYVSGKSALDPLWVLGLVAIGIGGALASRASRVRRPRRPASPGCGAGSCRRGCSSCCSARCCGRRLEHAPDPVAFILYAGLLFCGASLVVRGALLERRLRRMLEPRAVGARKPGRPRGRARAAQRAAQGGFPP